MLKSIDMFKKATCRVNFAIETLAADSFVAESLLFTFAATNGILQLVDVYPNGVSVHLRRLGCCESVKIVEDLCILLNQDFGYPPGPFGEHIWIHV